MAKRTRPKSAKVQVEADNISSTIIQLVHDAIIAVDEDQKIILFNQGAEKTFGYKASEVIGQRLDLLLPPQTSDPHIAHVRSFAKAPEIARLMGERKEISGRRKNGAIFPAKASIAKGSSGGRIFFTAILRDITERKQVEETLKSLAMFPSENPNPILRIQRDGVLLYANEACYRILQNWRLDIGKIVPLNLQVMVSESLAGQIEKIIETEHGQRIFSFIVIPVVEKGYANLYGRDITERRQVEGRLQESEEHFRTMFEQAAVGIAHVSTEGGWLLVNQRLCDIVGYTRDELLGLTFQDITHLDDLQTDLTYVQQLLTDEIKTYSMEKRYIRKDRSIVWINLTVSLVRETSGEPKYFISVVEDITERKRTEENLRQSEEKYRKLTETLPIGIAVTTPKGETVEANPALVKMSGYDSKEEFLQAPAIIHYLNPEDRSRYIAQLLERGAVLGFEMPLLRKDGSVFWASASSVTQKHPDGSITLVHSVEDISERKRAEMETQLLLALTKAVAEAESFDSALTLALSLVCRHTGWDFGEVWIPSHDGTHLELGSPYYGMESFQSVSKGFEFAPGIGLPGRVWASGKPIWIPDVTLDANFPRTALAAEAGFKAAVGIPILADDIVVAVINFFLREARQEDERMVALVSAVATQLGIAFQRKQTEDALHRSEATLIRAQKVGHIGSWVLDLQHNTLTWSAEVYRIFGMPPGTPLTYETFLACIHPEDREYADRSWQEALVGAPYDIEHRIVVGEEVKWAHERAELQFDAEGAPLNGIGTVQDITEHKRAEEALRKKDEHHKAVIESIFKFVPEGVLVLTESLNLLKQNKAFDDILQKYAPRLGYAEQELADEIIQQLRSKILGDENTEIRVPKKSK